MKKQLLDAGLRGLEDALPPAFREIRRLSNNFSFKYDGLVVPTEEPQRNYLWEVQFVHPFDMQGSYATFYAQQTAVPAGLVEALKRYYAGVEYSYPSRDSSPRIFRVTFWDNDSLSIYRYFEAWRQLTSYGMEQAKVNPQLYNRDIELRLKDITNLMTRSKFIMKTCRPIEIGEVSLSYTESELFLFDVLFTFTHKELV